MTLMDAAALLDALTAKIDALLPRAHELRHELHQSPYTGGFEEPTRDIMRAWLPWAEPELVADTGMIVSAGPAHLPAIGVRAELDALPIPEQSGLEWAATNGNSHTCGHDVHMAAAWALLEAARSVDDLPARVTVLFQPREENQPSGARDIVRAGALSRHDIAAVIGAHVQPVLPRGVVSTGVGAINAAFDEFEIIVRGRPGHGAYPHTTVDPIPVLANIITASHELISRQINPMNPAVITVGWVRAEGTENAIAPEARCGGTIRATTDEDRFFIHQRLQQLCEGIAVARGAEVEVNVDLGGPVLANDTQLVQFTDALLPRIGAAVHQPPLRSCGADDFSYYAEEVPIMMLFVGVDTLHPDTGLHHPSFVPDDDALRRTAHTLAAAYVAAVQRSVNAAAV